MSHHILEQLAIAGVSHELVEIFAEFGGLLRTSGRALLNEVTHPWRLFPSQNGVHLLQHNTKAEVDFERGDVNFVSLKRSQSDNELGAAAANTSSGYLLRVQHVSINNTSMRTRRKVVQEVVQMIWDFKIALNQTPVLSLISVTVLSTRRWNTTPL